MHPTNISIQAGPYGSIAIVVRDEEGRVVGHLVRPEEAVQLASNLMELAHRLDLRSGEGTVSVVEVRPN